MSRRRALAAVLLVAAAGTAGAFVRETASGDPATPPCLWWGARQVHYRVNATSAASPLAGTPCAGGSCAPCQDAAAAAALVASTLGEWGGATRAGQAQACTDAGLVYDGASTATAVGSDGVNLVIFRTGYCFGTSPVAPAGDACRGTAGACAAKYDCWEHDASGTIGLTTVSFDPTSGQLLDTDVEFHGWDGKVPANGYYLTCPATPSCSSSWWGPPPDASCKSTDVASVALHEAGHMLGLGHTGVASAVMYPQISAGPVRRTLDPDDVEGICTIYPKGAATLTCGNAPAPSSGGGCASAGGAGALALVGAALAMLRRRRR